MNKRRGSGLGSVTGQGWGASQRFDKDVKEEKNEFYQEWGNEPRDNIKISVFN